MPLVLNPLTSKFEYIPPRLVLNSASFVGGGGTSYSGFPAALAIETDSNLYWQLVIKDSNATTDHFGIVSFSDGTYGFQSEMYATTGTSVTFSPEGIIAESNSRGTGAVPGKMVWAGRNMSGSGAAGVLGLYTRGASARYLWFDSSGNPRYHTARPTEDNSVSDTAGIQLATLSAPTFTGPVTINEAAGSSALTITGATQTASFPALNLTQTWNNSAVVFIGADLNFTITAADATSQVLRVRSGASALFGVSRFGVAYAANYQVGSDLNVPYVKLDTTRVTMRSALYLGWGNGSPAGGEVGTVDLQLYRDAAGVLAQRNSTNAQAFNIYETYTDASNYSRIAMKAQAASYYQLIPQAAGTGTLRGLQLVGSSGLLGFYGATPIVQPTTAVTAATRVAGAGASVLVDDTYDGYTLAQIVKALRNIGLLA